MIPLTKIVATTDFSDESRKGVQVAFELTTHFRATLYMIHVVSPMPIIPGAEAPVGFHIPSVLKEMQDIAEASLEKLIKATVPRDIQAEREILTGDPAFEIVQFAEAVKADIIVMASHGQTGWKRFMSGSVTEKVVRYASIPVLAVKTPQGNGGQSK